MSAFQYLVRNKSVSVGISLLVICALSTLACHGSGKSSSTVEAKNTAFFATSPRSNALVVQETVNNVPPSEMSGYLERSYRLHPDARFIQAFVYIDRFFGGHRVKSPEAQFTGGKWHITWGTTELGTLEEPGDYPQMMPLLEKWAKERAHQSSVTVDHTSSGSEEINHEIEQFLAYHQFRALEKIETALDRKVISAALLKQACRSLTYLSLQMVDLTGIGDALPAAAWGMAAITKALTGSLEPRDEAMLAWSLDYTSAAVKICSPLAKDDPLKLYMNNRREALEKAVKVANGDILTKYLFLDYLAERYKGLQVFNYTPDLFPQDAYSLSLLALNMKSKAFATQLQFCKALVQRTYFDAKQLLEQGDDALAAWNKLTNASRELKVIGEFLGVIQMLQQIPQGTLFDSFEKMLRSLDEKFKGRKVMAPGVVRAFYQSAFYSALLSQGLFYRDRLASTQATEVFNDELKNEKKGRPGAFSLWYDTLTRCYTGKGGMKELIYTLRKNYYLGAPAMWRIIEELKEQKEYGAPAWIVATKHFTALCDYRPQYRKYCAVVYRWGLLDIKRSDHLLRTLSQVDSRKAAYQALYWAAVDGRHEQLKSMLKARNIAPEDRVQALILANQRQLFPKNKVIELFQRLTEEAPDSWRICEAYVDFLVKHGKYGKAVNLLKEKIPLYDKQPGLMGAISRAKLARVYEAMGKYKEGLKVIKPVISSAQGNALHAAASLYGKVGRKDKMIKTYKYLLQRYPKDYKAAIGLATYHWEKGEYDEAAAQLSGYTRIIGPLQWRKLVGELFVKQFKNDPKKMLKASQALLNYGITPLVPQQLAYRLKEEGYPLRAFELISSVKPRNWLFSLELKAEAYNYLKMAKGKAKALKWLKTQIPLKMYQPLSQVAVRTEAYDLLWDFLPLHTQGPHSSAVWCNRAIAYCKLRKHDQKKKQLIIDNCKGKEQDRYAAYPLFLMGQMSQATLLSYIKDVKSRSEVCYMIGLKAQSEGRLGDAVDWYRLSVETGRKVSIEYRWAYDQLFNWFGQAKSLTQIAEEMKVLQAS